MDDFEEQIEAKYLAIPSSKFCLKYTIMKNFIVLTHSPQPVYLFLMLAKVVEFKSGFGLMAQGCGDRGAAPHPE